MTETKFFDPAETVRGIQQILVSDKKKIAFLFGAGTSLAKKTDNSPSVPAVGKMTELVVNHLKEDVGNGEKYEKAIEEIKTELEQQNMCFNIETLLSNIEEKSRIIGGGQLNNLNKSALQDMDDKIRKKIQKLVSVHMGLGGKEATLIQYDFAKWICNADRKYAVEIFTTNYDYLFEIGLEAVGIPYYDGFTGSYKPFFNSHSLEDMGYLPQQTKLWKIHGSLGLHEEKAGNSKKIVRMNSDNEDLLIYPSSLKYSNSKKLPYVAFMDRLNNFLKQEDAVLFVCGYSFGDEHINERILSALNTNSTSHVFVLYYDIEGDNGTKKYVLTPDCTLAQIASNNRRISVLGTRKAIIGSAYGTWKLKREPDKNDSLNTQWFFDEDAPINVDVKINEEQKGNETWTGKGELTLPDFIHFVNFLKYMIPKNEWEDSTNE